MNKNLGTANAFMYHYVRDFNKIVSPIDDVNIKGLAVEKFERELIQLKKQYHIISMEELIAAFYNGEKLDKKSIVLTFDDGYSDCYNTVFPILKKHNVKAAFYIVSSCVKNHVILDVNKVHYILINADENNLLSDLEQIIIDNKTEYHLKTIEEYKNEYMHANRWDSKEIIFIKRMLQVALPLELRAKVCDQLFEKYVHTNQAEFSKLLYMNEQQIVEMAEAGMHMGVHTNKHFWLDSLSKEEQESEIKISYDFLSGLGLNMENWTIAYPYGAYNEDTLEIVERLGAKLAFTTTVGSFELDRLKVYQLPRFDCNDISSFI